MTALALSLPCFVDLSIPVSFCESYRHLFVAPWQCPVRLANHGRRGDYRFSREEREDRGDRRFVEDRKEAALNNDLEDYMKAKPAKERDYDAADRAERDGSEAREREPSVGGSREGSSERRRDGSMDRRGEK